jgi:C-3',4' desaturase CrtD
MPEMRDVAILGAGMAGMAVAARLQASGSSTMVFEAHGQPGGCAGFYRRRGFAFDVGATTLVDFEPGGVGAELLESIGMPPLDGEALPGYVAWLPDRVVTLYRDPAAWAEERLRAIGDSPAHRAFWRLLDHLAVVFWRASRRGITLPVDSPHDLLRAVAALGLRNLPLARYINWTMGDALHAYGLEGDRPLVGLLSMLIEDTVHSTVEQAPLINAALGVTIRGAGLTRARGGMWGFWQRLRAQYHALGGELRVGCAVDRVSACGAAFIVHTRRGDWVARQVVSALPAAVTARIAPAPVAQALAPFLSRDAQSLGGALVVFLGVPESQLACQPFTHHQLLQDYNRPLGYGNNMFISASAPGDTQSAPAGHRAVMISTHCDLESWEQLTPEAYAACKREVGEELLRLARRVYPQLGADALVMEVATPRTYARYLHRPRGAVGGVRQTLGNANQHAIPHQLGVPGFWLAGDSTWPGLGTVACVLGSRIVANGALRLARARACYVSHASNVSMLSPSQVQEDAHVTHVVAHGR